MRLSSEKRRPAESWSPRDGACVYPCEDGFIYTASNANPVSTCRQPGVILIALDDQPIAITTEHEKISGTLLLVSPRVRRSIAVEHSRFIAIHIEPSHPSYRALLPRDDHCWVRRLGDGTVASLRAGMDACHAGELNPTEAADLLTNVMDCVLDQLPEVLARDDRIDRVLRSICDTSVSGYSFEELLRMLSISASRLSHLFASEVGLSLRSYLLWRKVREALTMFDSDADLTTIAHNSGFADSAHCSRTFKAILGVSPSILADDRYVQIFH